LDELLKRCAEAKLIDPEHGYLGQFIRVHRNLIHPGAQAGKNISLNKEKAHIALNAIKLLTIDLNSS
jgi:hypothetical protein